MTELPMTFSLMRVNRDSLAKRYFQVDFSFPKMLKMFTELTYRGICNTNCSAIVTLDAINVTILYSVGN